MRGGPQLLSSEALNGTDANNTCSFYNSDVEFWFYHFLWSTPIRVNIYIDIYIADIFLIYVNCLLIIEWTSDSWTLGTKFGHLKLCCIRLCTLCKVYSLQCRVLYTDCTLRAASRLLIVSTDGSAISPPAGRVGTGHWDWRQPGDDTRLVDSVL